MSKHAECQCIYRDIVIFSLIHHFIVVPSTVQLSPSWLRLRVTACGGLDFLPVFCHILHFHFFPIWFHVHSILSQRTDSSVFFISSLLLVLHCTHTEIYFFDLVHLVLSMLFMFPPDQQRVTTFAYSRTSVSFNNLPQELVGLQINLKWRSQGLFKLHHCKFSVVLPSWFPLIAVSANVCMAFHKTY